MTMKRYSRLASTEESKNLKKAYIYIALSIIALVFLVFLGIPTLVKFAGFIGTIGRSNKDIEITDTIPPAPPQFDDLPEFTNNEVLNITGTSENGAIISITANSNSSEVVADIEGKFSFTFNLNKGENTIKAVAKDISGNTSVETKEYKIIFDNTDPKLEVNSPKDGDSFYGSGQRQVTIKGTVDELVDLTINNRFVTVKEDKTFLYATTLSEGDNTFEVKAVDRAGNESKISFLVKFSL